MPSKLLEGNVFKGVSRFIGEGRGPHVTITHDALDLTEQAPAMPPPNIRHEDPMVPALAVTIYITLN